jgi:sterol 14-demethylase
MPSPPPALPGLPLLGNLLAFRKDPVALCAQGYTRCGPIFSIRLGPQRAVVVVGPEHNKFVFAHTDDVFSLREPYAILSPIVGKEAAFAIGAPDFKKVRTEIMNPAFQGKKIAAYIPMMVEETNRWLDTLGPRGSFDMERAFGNLILGIATRIFIGDDFQRSVGPDYWELFRDLFEGMDFTLPPYLPLPRFRRRDRARRRLKDLIEQYLRRERKGEPFSEYVADLLKFAEANKPSAAMEIVVSNLLGIVWGAHGTTTGHLSWTLIQLLQNEEYRRRVMREREEALADGAEVSSATLRRMPRLEWAIKESERMHPVMPLLPRYNAKAYELEGYAIPAGWMTFACPTVTHGMREVFKDPERYDPERFDPERAQGSDELRALVGFGGGAHRCPGENLAVVEMKTILSVLLGRYDMELVTPKPETTTGFVVMGPRSPCMVRYRARA